MSQIVPLKNEVFQEQIKELTVQGLSQTEVAGKLGIDRRTVYRYIQKMQKEIKSELEKKRGSFFDILADFLIKYQERYKENWILYNRCKEMHDYRTAAKYQEIINKIETDRIKVLMSLGVITNNAGNVAEDITVRFKRSDEDEREILNMDRLSEVLKEVRLKAKTELQKKSQQQLNPDAQESSPNI